MLELRHFKRFKKEDKTLLPNLVQPLLDDNEANTSNTNDTEGESETWFWHKSANESDSNSEEERYSNVDVEGSNLEGKQPSYEKSSRFEREQPSHEGLARLKNKPREIRWNIEGGTKLRGGYGKSRTQL